MNVDFTPAGSVQAGQPAPATRTGCIVWSSKSQAIIGGLQRQVDRLAAEADTLQLKVSVVSPPDGSAGSNPENRRSVARYRSSLEAVGSLLGTAAILYCARLYKGLERAQQRTHGDPGGDSTAAGGDTTGDLVHGWRSFRRRMGHIQQIRTRRASQT